MCEVTSDEARAELAAALARDLRQLDLQVAAAFVESQEREVERLQQRDRLLDGLRLQLTEAEALIRRLLTTEKDIAPHDRRRGERLVVTIGELLTAKQEGSPRA
jgi:hypothetical protein